MNTDLLSANVSLALMAVVAAAFLAHLSQIAGAHRLLHGVYAATAAGLLYLFGAKALGWSFIPREALLATYAGLFVVVAGVALLRRGADRSEPIPWSGLLIEQAAMAYIFAPTSFWKPPVSALLLLYFLLELYAALKGREQEVEKTGHKDFRPPLFPPKRVRGLRELALAGAAAALVYVFAMGTGRAPVPPAPEEPAPQEQTAAEQPTNEEATAPAESQSAESPPIEAKPAEEAQAAAKAPAPAARPSRSYTAAAGETLKSIAKKIYGKADTSRRPIRASRRRRS